MLNVRRISQIVFLSIFLLLFLIARYPLTTKIPVNIFLRLDPLIVFTISISDRVLHSDIWIALIIISLTVLFGRVFCGWFCPLGTFLDIFSKVKSKKSKVKSNSITDFRIGWIKYALLSSLIFACVFSLNLTGVFDPLSILTRSLSLSIFPLLSFSLREVMSRLAENSDFLYSLNETITSIFVPQDIGRFRGDLLVFVLFLGIIFLEFIQRRFWCRNLCPLGALLGLFSKFRVFNRFVDENCISCNPCKVECKMGAIKSENGESLATECVTSLSCTKVCPSESSISYKFKLKSVHREIDFSRRKFILSAFSGILGFGVFRSSFLDREAKGMIVRPPGSLPESEFLSRCIRCGECVRVCGTAGRGLQFSIFEAGIEAFWTPFLDARNGYCEYNCTMCTEVCPSGAIHKLPLEVKRKKRIGTAFFDKSRCIPYVKKEDCLVCEEHCPTPEKAIIFKEEVGVLVSGLTRIVKMPYVREDLCIGCGICVTKCPVKGKAGIFLTNEKEERWIES